MRVDRIEKKKESKLIIEQVHKEYVTQMKEFYNCTCNKTLKIELYFEAKKILSIDLKVIIEELV